MPRTKIRPRFRRPSSDFRATGSAVPNPNRSGTLGLDFFKASHIGKVGTRSTVSFGGLPPSGPRKDGFGRMTLNFAITHKGKAYSWSIREGSPNHQILYERFKGEAPDGDVAVVVEAPTGEGMNPYVAIEE